MRIRERSILRLDGRGLLSAKRTRTSTALSVALKDPLNPQVTQSNKLCRERPRSSCIHPSTATPLARACAGPGLAGSWYGHNGPREVHDIASGHPGLYLCGIGERQARDVGPRAPMELAHQKIIGAKRVEALLYHCSKIFALRSMSRRSESRWMPFEPCRGARRQSGSPCE
jgi:hypothetical protein